MILERLVVGPLGVNCYILGDDAAREAFVIDPGGNARDILNALQLHQLKVSAIVNTHAHFDHVVALDEIRAATGAPFMIHVDEADMLAKAQASAALFGLAIPLQKPADRLLHDGDELNAGKISLKVLHTPGHTPGGICLLNGKVRAQYIADTAIPSGIEPLLFAGDTLFQGSIGRTDFPGGDYAALMRSIRDKLFPLPDDTVVYPGHGSSTTLREEKTLNPFLRPLMTGEWNV